MNLRNVAKFLAVMQLGEGLFNKSPAYIEEKLHTIALYDGDWDPIDLLDGTAQATYRAWESKWQGVLE